MYLHDAHISIFVLKYLKKFICNESDWNKTWSVLAKDELAILNNVDSCWMELEQAFNTISKEILISTPITEPLRLVMDDDKVHCESKDDTYWSTIQKMKHVVCNRWGLTVHTLASSTTGLIYGIRTQRKEDSTCESVKKVLGFLFKKRNSDLPDLTNVFVSVDRGYSDSKNLITWIVKSLGNIFGTMKRTLWAPFTFDQKKYFAGDQRVFEKSEGFRFSLMKYLYLKDNNKNISFFTAFFYRNGFGGATMLQSTEMAHRFNLWDRVEKDSLELRQIHIGQTRTYFLPIKGISSTTNYQLQISEMFENLI